MNVNVIQNGEQLPVGVRLLFFLCANVNDGDNSALAKKSALAERFKVSRQTVGSYLQKFCASGIMKYKYSGAYMINPDFYYKGKTRDVAAKKYKSFRSDIATAVFE